MFGLELLETFFALELQPIVMSGRLAGLLPISSIPFPSGRLSATVPSVRMHGSNAASNLAPPLCIGDGPKDIVLPCVEQSGVDVTAPVRS